MPAEPTKPERQKLVASLVSRSRIGTQQELVDALGRPRYVLPGGDRRTDPRATLDSLLAQFGRSAVAARNIVVLQAEIGSAPAIARALDRLEHPEVVGTLAGDDTCLVIAHDDRRARALARELSASIDSG